MCIHVMCVSDICQRSARDGTWECVGVYDERKGNILWNVRGWRCHLV